MAPTLQTTSNGFPAQFASKIENIYPNQNGDSVSVTCVGGETLIGILIGLKDFDPFDLIHGSTTAPGFILGINDYNALPTISDSSPDSATITNVAETSTALTLTAASQPATSIVLASVANAVSTSTTYTGTVTGGGANAFAGFTFTVAGFTNAANNGSFVCTASTGTTLVLTNSGGIAETHAATAVGPSGSTVYTGTITGGAANAFVGAHVTVAGFVTAGNNGTGLLVTASTATTLVVANALGANETHAGTATNFILTITAANNFIQGDSVKFAGLTTATFLNGQTATVLSSGGTTFTADDPTRHGTYGSAADTGTASRTSGNDWALASGASLTQFGSDYTVSATPPTAPNPYPSVKWSLDGFLPSIYIFTANNVSAGTYKVTAQSMYQTGLAPNWQYGRPIFDGGVNFQVIKFTGMTAAAADGATVSAASSTANPAVPLNSGGTTATITTTGTGDLVFAVAIQKSANGLGTGPTDGTLSTQYGRISNGKLVGSEAHYLVQWGIQTSAGAWTPSFANPLGYETLISAIAIKHS